MDKRPVLFVLGYLLLILGLSMLAPLAVAILYDSNSPYEAREVAAFGWTAGFSVVAGLLLRHFYRDSAENVGRREGFAIVTFSWVIAVVVGMMPYLITGATTSVTDAFFETMSGFTTTGATIFPKVEVIPHGLQFWRCMTQWLGGMGIVVLSVALLPMLGVGGYRMLKAETPGGVAFEWEKPRITDAAKDMWRLYLIISGAEFILLKLTGMTVFDSLCHTFTTMSTGGFSPHSESVAYFGPMTQWVIIVFMFLAGINFSLHAQFVRGRFREPSQNPEFRLYAGIIAVVIVLGIIIVNTGSGVEERVRDVTFQTIAIVTTTGYVTADFNAWPHVMRLILLGLMFVGASMGSTGGGMKVARILVYAKAFFRELHRLLYPHAVRPIRIGDKVIDRRIVSNIIGFGIAFFAAFILGALVMAACGYDLTTSLSASVAALGNIGPGLGEVGPTANWSHLPAVAKWVMSFLMLIGRLELLSVLVLFTPWMWKR